MITKEGVEYLYRKGEETELENAERAADTFRYIADYIEGHFNKKIIGPILKRIPIKNPNPIPEQNYDFETEPPRPKDCPAGLIRVLCPRQDIKDLVNQIMIDKFLINYNLRINSGSDCNGGLETAASLLKRPNNRYVLFSTNGRLHPPTSIADLRDYYGEFCQEFLEANKAQYEQLGLKPDPQAPVDRIVIAGKTDPKICIGAFYLEIGKRLKPQRPLLRKIFPYATDIKPDWANIGFKEIPGDFFG